MESTSNQLHPNWRALATIHYPLKRFIREGYEASNKGTLTRSKRNYEIHIGVDGKDVKKFYEEIVNDDTNVQNDSTQTKVENLNASSCSKKQNIDKHKLPFNINKFFQYAVSNNVDELRKIEFKTDDINSTDFYGWTALMMSACEGAIDVVKELLANGADPNIQEKTGLKAVNLAREKGHIQIVKLLQENRLSNSTPGDLERKAKVSNSVKPFYCTTCKKHFTETSLRDHQTSTVHQFNVKPSLSQNKLQKFNIPSKNRGLQLMIKQGWDKESGLGPNQRGRLYPVKTVIRKNRTGLGIDQTPARVTHFDAFDTRAVKRSSDVYQKKSRTKNEMLREKRREWKRERRLRNELS